MFSNKRIAGYSSIPREPDITFGNFSQAKGIGTEMWEASFMERYLDKFQTT